jgi:hypothetical protein
MQQEPHRAGNWLRHGRDRQGGVYCNSNSRKKAANPEAVGEEARSAGEPPGLCGSAGGTGRSRKTVWTLGVCDSWVFGSSCAAALRTWAGQQQGRIAVGAGLPEPGAAPQLAGARPVSTPELHRVELARGSPGLSVPSRLLCPLPLQAPLAPPLTARRPQLRQNCNQHSAPGPAWITSVPSRPVVE